MSVLTSTPTGTRAFDEAVEQLRDDLGRDYSGWFCISTDPYPCPAPGCEFVANHLTAAHLVVVWPSRDDRMLLTYANDAANVGRNPRVVEYESRFGDCIPYDAWVSIGRPVHGLRERPSDARPFREF